MTHWRALRRHVVSPLRVDTQQTKGFKLLILKLINMHQYYIYRNPWEGVANHSNMVIHYKLYLLQLEFYCFALSQSQRKLCPLSTIWYEDKTRHYFSNIFHFELAKLHRFKAKETLMSGSLLSKKVKKISLKELTM
jgi:hypothetical protein